jgi:hypothetical protein
MNTSGTTTTRRRALVAAFALLALTSVSLAGTAPSAGAAPYCGITWGSLDRSVGDLAGGRMHNVRSGQHACFDRLVIDIGPGPGVAGYHTGYTARLRGAGSGELLPRLRGGISLSIVVDVPAHDDDYNPTYDPANRYEAVNVSGYRTFRQVAFYGTYEGQTQLGIGVRARLPYRVFVLAGPAGGQRVVIDIAHRWS